MVAAADPPVGRQCYALIGRLGTKPESWRRRVRTPNRVVMVGTDPPYDVRAMPDCFDKLADVGLRRSAVRCQRRSLAAVRQFEA